MGCDWEFTDENAKAHYTKAVVTRVGAAIYGNEKSNALFIRVFDKSGEERLTVAFNVLLCNEMRAVAEHLDNWVVQVGGTESRNVVEI